MLMVRNSERIGQFIDYSSITKFIYIYIQMNLMQHIYAGNCDNELDNGGVTKNSYCCITCPDTKCFIM